MHCEDTERQVQHTITLCVCVCVCVVCRAHRLFKCSQAHPYANASVSVCFSLSLSLLLSLYLSFSLSFSSLFACIDVIACSSSSTLTLSLSVSLSLSHTHRHHTLHRRTSRPSLHTHTTPSHISSLSKHIVKWRNSSVCGNVFSGAVCVCVGVFVRVGVWLIR